MRNNTLCFTGHRKIPPEQYDSIARRLQKEIIDYIVNGYLYFGAGGALGFDTLAAQTILRLKKDYPIIRLILVLPCITQSYGWNEMDKSIYEDIKSQADKVVYTSQEYLKGCMFKRNRHLVDNSSACICYLTENKGGTYYTVNYARQNNLKITNIAEELGNETD